MHITIEVTGRPRRRIVVAVLALGLLLPATVLGASAFYSDVSSTSSFRASIDAITEAGITSGCGTGTFCPTANITRQQEAVFVHRAASRVAVATTIDDSTVGDDNLVGDVTITVGGTNALGIGANQFVTVSGAIGISGNTTAAGCPCTVGVYINDGSSFASSPGSFYVLPAMTYFQGMVEESWVFEAAPGSRSYVMEIYVASTDDVLTFSSLKLIAETSTFGHDGKDSLSAAGMAPAANEPRGSTPTR